ncbi:MAG: RNA polymerase sigma factor [Oscillospiraceae bacterium]|jgi:RNA polymerase sigma factor (sigma-70 family)|nr:RNA polymerase sigma factor [Oscillospiraceae bacterium]
MTGKEFSALYAAHERVLQRYVYCKLPSKADGDDVLQEIALAAYQAKDALQDPARGKAWLLGIASHKCGDWFRRAARRNEVPLECLPEAQLFQTRAGLDLRDDVRETLAGLSAADRELLSLYYWRQLPQNEIAARLGIPIGTVKSRLHTARGRFQRLWQGAAQPLYQTERCDKMLHELPVILPEYQIEASAQPAFRVRCEELMGWFIVPRLGEKLRFGLYDQPGRSRTEAYELEVTGPASVHGAQGVAITAKEVDGGQHEAVPARRSVTRAFVAQLTDTHSRFLAEAHEEDGVLQCFTFLDGDEFLRNWGYGEENCGRAIALSPKGLITRSGSVLTAPRLPCMDVVGRYTVCLGGRSYDTICLIDLETYDEGVLGEQFIGADGRTVLWRRFNRNDWRREQYGLWTEFLPGSEVLRVNGERYVHWYDCVTAQGV